VRHIKSEMAASVEPEDFFRFEWALTLTLTREASELLSADVSVRSVDWTWLDSTRLDLA
jgi:hypothetical protein